MGNSNFDKGIDKNQLIRKINFFNHENFWKKIFFIRIVVNTMFTFEKNQKKLDKKGKRSAYLVWPSGSFLLRMTNGRAEIPNDFHHFQTEWWMIQGKIWRNLRKCRKKNTWKTCKKMKKKFFFKFFFQKNFFDSNLGVLSMENSNST